MTTNYESIVNQYQQSKLQPWRTYIEAHSLMSLMGNLQGMSVLDLACGSGYYSRLIRRSGADRVLGVDLSPAMIELGRRLEAEEPLNIEYCVADAKSVQLPQKFDIVAAAYLLNYAQSPEELAGMAASIARHLKSGGRFVTVNSSPHLHFPSAPSFRQYGFETRASLDWTTGTPIQWVFHVESGPFQIENYYLSPDIHEQVFRDAGFTHIHWHPPRLAPFAEPAESSGHWQTFLSSSPITLMECLKAG